MKRLVGLSVVLGLLLAIPASHQVFGKAHVRVGKVQVCHKGKTITVSENALRAHLRHGDIQLPACDFNNVFQTGDNCGDVVDSNNDGQADFGNRDDAGGMTDACPEGAF